MTAKHLIVSILSLSLLIGWNSQASAAEQPGKIMVVAVEGTATISGLDGSSSKPLAQGGTITEGQRVVTGPASKVVLLFANGSIFTVNEKTTFDIQQFLQKPFDAAKVDFTKIKKEPSNSTTKVKVGKGEVVADIRKLNRGSDMDIATPVGVAGIRGTKVKVTVTQNANGTFNVNYSVPEGTILVNTPDGQSVSIGEGGANSLNFTASINPTTGEITMVGAAETSTLTPAQVQAINAELAAAESSVIVADPSGRLGEFTTPADTGAQAPPPTSGATGSSGGSGDQGVNNAGQGPAPSS